MRGTSVMCAPDRIERPTASASSWITVSTICSGRLVQAGVDHLHARVAQGAGDDLGAAIVAVQAGLRDDDTDRAVHRGESTERSRVRGQSLGLGRRERDEHASAAARSSGSGARRPLGDEQPREPALHRRRCLAAARTRMLGARPDDHVVELVLAGAAACGSSATATRSTYSPALDRSRLAQELVVELRPAAQRGRLEPRPERSIARAVLRVGANAATGSSRRVPHSLEDASRAGHPTASPRRRLADSRLAGNAPPTCERRDPSISVLSRSKSASHSRGRRPASPGTRPTRPAGHRRSRPRRVGAGALDQVRHHVLVDGRGADRSASAASTAAWLRSPRTACTAPPGAARPRAEAQDLESARRRPR